MSNITTRKGLIYIYTLITYKGVWNKGHFPVMLHSVFVESEINLKGRGFTKPNLLLGEQI